MTRWWELWTTTGYAWFWIMRWVRSPWPCKWGQHVWDENRWGFGGAVIDWYCGRCDLRFGWTALDDASPEQQDRVQAGLRVLGVAAVGVDVQDGQA